MKIAAIVLAAGKSERMGKNKLLLKINETTLIEQIIQAIKKTKISEIIVVLGYKPEKIIEIISQRFSHVKTVINEEYEAGMTSSFKKGVQHALDSDAVMLFLGDQPVLNSRLINVMINKFQERKNEVDIVSPIYKGKKGHPVLFSSRLFKEILSLEDAGIIRDVVHRHSDKHLLVEGEKWNIVDVDTYSDFQWVKKELLGEHGQAKR